MNLTSHVHRRRTLAAATGVVVLLLSAAACGSKDADATAQTGEQGGPQSQQNRTAGRVPGANGKVAAVDGHTAQVQGDDGQVAVSWTGSTTFTKEVEGALADIKVGDCVAVGSQDTAGSSPSAAVTATTVRVMAKTNGSCTPSIGGPGGPAGAGPQTYGGPPPASGGGGPRPQMRFGGAVGEVTAVSATGFTVKSALPGSGSSSTSITVTVGSGTTYTATAKGAAGDVKVGVCVAAQGSTDQTGAITARMIAISAPQDGQCGGFMRMRSDGGGASSQES